MGLTDLIHPDTFVIAVGGVCNLCWWQSLGSRVNSSTRYFTRVSGRLLHMGSHKGTSQHQFSALQSFCFATRGMGNLLFAGALQRLYLGEGAAGGSHSPAAAPLRAPGLLDASSTSPRCVLGPGEPPRARPKAPSRLREGPAANWYNQYLFCKRDWKEGGIARARNSIDL